MKAQGPSPQLTSQIIAGFAHQWKWGRSHDHDLGHTHQCLTITVNSENMTFSGAATECSNDRCIYRRSRQLDLYNRTEPRSHTVTEGAGTFIVRRVGK